MLYQPQDQELTLDREKTVEKLYVYNQLNPLDGNNKNKKLKELLGKVGENCTVQQPFFCTYGYNIFLGNQCFINVNCKLMDSAEIKIGNNVFIAPNVCLITEKHDLNVKQRVAGLEYAYPVTIENNVWICTGAIVLPGITIGENSVIGAGSVVTKNIPPNSLAVGNPCKVIRYLEESENIKKWR